MNELLKQAESRLESAKALFANCDAEANEKLFDYANAELTAATKYLEFVISTTRSSQ